MSGLQKTYRAFLITPSGERLPLEGQALVVELEPGKEIELDLTPHPNHPGDLVVRTGSELDVGNRAGHLAMLVLRPAACNLVHLSVEHHPWQEVAPENVPGDA